MCINWNCGGKSADSVVETEVRIELVKAVVEFGRAVLVESGMGVGTGIGTGTHGMHGPVGETLTQLPSLLGRQFTQDFPAFTQAQPLHKPDLLHLQHTILGTQARSVARLSLLFSSV